MYLPMLANSVEVEPGVLEEGNLRSRVLAVYLCDFSGSMSHLKPQVQQGWINLLESLAKRPLDRQRVELAFCAFACQVSFHDFGPVTSYETRNLHLDVGGSTSLGLALQTVVAQTKKRWQLLASHGIECDRRVCVVVTDGAATDDINQVIPLVQNADASGELEFVPLSPNRHCNPQLVNIFGKEPIPVDAIDFDALFGVLARSLSQLSQGCGSQVSAYEVIRQQTERRTQLPGQATGDQRRIGYLPG